MRWLLPFLLAIPLNAATWYVATNGLDTNPGSEAEPFLTIQKGVDSAYGGDTVLVASGIYTNATSARGGTNGTRIVIDGQSLAQIASFYSSHSNITVQNFTFKGKSNAWWFYMEKGSHFNTISNCVFDGDYNTNMQQMIRWGNPVPGEYPWGVNVASGCLIISNTFKEQWGGEGNAVMQVFGDTNKVVGNLFRDGMRCDWIQMWGRSNVCIGNTFSNLVWTELCGNHSDWFQIWGGEGGGGAGKGAYNILIESNIVIGGEYSTQIGMVEGQDNPDMSHITFRNNLIIGFGAGFSVSASNVSWLNNTFIDCNTNVIPPNVNGGDVLTFTVATNSTYLDTNLCAGNNGRVLNNVFLNCGGTNMDRGWYNFDLDTFAGQADYNFVSKSDYSAVPADAEEKSVGDPGGWELQEWWEDHGINGGNPLLGNYRPLVGSPLINTGTNLASEFTTDLDGNTRGTLWDIGAFEYEEATTTPLACAVEPKTVRAYSFASSGEISLAWPTNQYRTILTISRRAYTNNPVYWQAWTHQVGYTNGTVSNAGSWTDTNATNGVHYEYRIAAMATNWDCGGTTNMVTWAFEHLSTGYRVPLKDDRGNLLLVIESGVAANLGSDISVLTNDLIGAGYRVYRYDVAGVEVTNAGWSAAVAATKAAILSNYLSDTTRPWTLFILGHVPIPYSGDNSPGSHADNQGAHPADWYYADTNETLWADVGVNDSTADDPPQWNVPGDGKFDTNWCPSMPEMRLGRVDLFQMPWFGNQTNLLSQYLQRNHQWRHKQFTVTDRGIVLSNSLAYDAHNIYASAFGNNSSLVLTNPIWFATNTGNSALHFMGKSTGGYEADYSIGYYNQVGAHPIYIPFISTYGSYYGDWDSGMRSNIFLSCWLAADGYVLAVNYREDELNFDFCTMAEPIGQEMFSYAANQTLDISKLYMTRGWMWGVDTYWVPSRAVQYISLQGDPTLQWRVVGPPTNAVASTNGNDIVLAWTASTDNGIEGYHVYRAPATDLNDFTRLTTAPTNSPYTNAGGAAAAYTYMVRAIKLEDTPQRSFYNASQGIFATTEASASTNTLQKVTLRGARVTTRGKVTFR